MRTMRHLLTAAALCLLCLPASAETPAPLTAALAACALGPAGISERLDRIAATGWVVAPDSDKRRMMLGLASVASIPSMIRATDDKLRTRLSDIRNTALPPQGQADGTHLSADTVLEQATKAIMMVTDLEVPDSTALFRIGVQQVGTADAHISCRLFLTDPQPPTVLDGMIPEGALVSDKLVQDSSIRIIAISKDGRLIARLTHIDLTYFSAFQELPASLGSQTRLATVVEIEANNIPLR